MQNTIFKPRQSANVLVVGDIILDQYIYGETNRVSPEAPVPVVRVKEMEERPGGAANVAVNVSALGVNVQLLGITGCDEASRRLEDILQGRNVECHFIRQDGFPTITKRRVLSRHQQLIRLDYENKMQKTDARDLIDSYTELIKSAELIILSDYAKGSLIQVKTLIEKARAKNIPVLVDPKSVDFELYKSANIITPNEKEIESVIGAYHSEAELVERGGALCKKLELEALLVTRGERGMLLLRRDKAPLHLKAETHEVYDVAGAGDTVIAVLGGAMVCGYAVEEATGFANAAAGLVVEKLGAATVSVEELNTKLTGNRKPTGITDADTALSKIKQSKRKGEKVVMTNGCFDILHAGHISCLTRARRLGDQLVVAINSDDSVKLLKGASRPVNALRDRMRVVDALACVDIVVSFDEETPETLIAYLEPDVLVKGGDYKEEEIAGAESVRRNGGEVVILPLEAGYSTSAIVSGLIDKAGASA